MVIGSEVVSGSVLQPQWPEAAEIRSDLVVGMDSKEVDLKEEGLDLMEVDSKMARIVVIVAVNQ
jgi:hypothetical protein